MDMDIGRINSIVHWDALKFRKHEYYRRNAITICMYIIMTVYSRFLILNGDCHFKFKKKKKNDNYFQVIYNENKYGQ